MTIQLGDYVRRRRGNQAIGRVFRIEDRFSRGKYRERAKVQWPSKDRPVWRPRHTRSWVDTSQLVKVDMCAGGNPPMNPLIRIGDEQPDANGLRVTEAGPVALPDGAAGVYAVVMRNWVKIVSYGATYEEAVEKAKAAYLGGEVSMKATIPIDVWRARGLELGGGTFLDCPFVCPLCGNIATPRDFQAAGAEPARAAQECIGRVVGAAGGLSRGNQATNKPCDWAAFGLLGTLNGGATVVHPDGTTTDVFAFADQP